MRWIDVDTVFPGFKTVAAHAREPNRQSAGHRLSLFSDLESGRDRRSDPWSGGHRLRFDRTDADKIRKPRQAAEESTLFLEKKGRGA